VLDRVHELRRLTVSVRAVRIQNRGTRRLEGAQRIEGRVLIPGQPVAPGNQQRPGSMLEDGGERVSEAGPLFKRTELGLSELTTDN
jgi:hypothetical protein